MSVALRHSAAITTQDLSEALRGCLENSLLLNKVKIYIIVELRRNLFLRIIKMKSPKL